MQDEQETGSIVPFERRFTQIKNNRGLAANVSNLLPRSPTQARQFRQPPIPAPRPLSETDGRTCRA